MIVSVVIPTFNRGPLLADTVEHLLRNNLPRDGLAEIIVVDDGSQRAAEDALVEVSITSGFSLRVVRQANAGPASARNTGFRAAKGDVVLFVDDDILVRPDVIGRHFEAHQRLPRSVVFGRCPFSADSDSPALRYINELVSPLTSAPYAHVDRIASGHLSVERAQFAAAGGLYREDLRTPAAEEFELSYRLRNQGIPMVFVSDIVGIHLQSAKLSALCTQQYKYGIGLAEAMAKCGDLRNMSELQAILRANEPPRLADPLGIAASKIMKALFIPRTTRRGVMLLASLLERTLREGALLHTTYRVLLGTHLHAGLREGRRLYSLTPRP